MKASVGFFFFMLFLAGIALVNLKGMKERSDSVVTSASDIADTAWRPTHLGAMRLRDDTPMILRFNSETEIAGHAGCNRFSGEYTVANGALEFRSIGTTRMACPEPENSFELSFLAALQSVRSASRAEKRLTMRDDSGLVVARFLAAEIAGTR